MLPFDLTPLGANVLMNSCRKNPLLETILIKGLNSSEFIVRRKKNKWFYNMFNLGTLFKIEEVEVVEGEKSFTFFPNINLFYELEIKQLSELIELIELCRDKTEDKMEIIK